LDGGITTYRLKSELVENKYWEDRKKKWENRVYKHIPEKSFDSENWLKLTSYLNVSKNTKTITICYRQTNHPVLYLKFGENSNSKICP
jgi:hypothetical protein